MALTETAYAKINLALHVRERRVDGYHELETLFAFVDAGDILTARIAKQDQLTVSGEFAGGLGESSNNLIAKALNVLPRAEGLAINLEKNLPVAAGLGGGSADAGAVFRLVREASGLPDDWQERAKRLGADVPACVNSRTCIGRGIGTELENMTSDLTGMAVLLVNPRIPLATAQVFQAWDQIDRGGLPSGSVREMALSGRNDLEGPAIALIPAIADILGALRKSEAILSRMSGSGATCFGLFETQDIRDETSQRLSRDHPEWWQLRGSLR